MRQRRLGELQVSVVGLGCSKFGSYVDAAATRAVVNAALDAGISFFDTADVYGGEGRSERVLGEATRAQRDDVVLATKWGMAWTGDGEPPGPSGSRAYVRRSAELSLSRLGTDRIDLYQYHLPDGVTPIEETLGALDELVTEGKVRAIGCSNFTGAQLAEAADVARANGFASFVSLQNEYSLLERSIEAEVIPQCRRLGVGVIPYFPLASGLLTGKYRRGRPGPPLAPPHAPGGPGDDETYDRLDALAAFATKRDLEPTDVAIGGLAARPTVASVIAGATSPEQVRANAAAAAWEPTASDMAELEEILTSPSRPVRGGRLAALGRRLRGRRDG